MLEQGPNTHVSCNREEGLDFYKKMQIIRRMEASANNMYKSKLIRGFCHLYSGQVRRTLEYNCIYSLFLWLIGSCLRWHESSNG